VGKIPVEEEGEEDGIGWHDTRSLVGKRPNSSGEGEFFQRKEKRVQVRGGV